MVYVRRLIWDSWNVAHIARHEATPEEVEEACHGDALVQQTYAARLLLIGPTLAGKILAVVRAPESWGVYYPVPARPASKKERTLYKRAKGTDAT
jgi:uncharacterized protein